MVRNIACRFQPHDVAAELQRVGLGDFDYLYVPMNSKGKANLGYFFVNFTSVNVAMKAVQLLQGQTFGQTLSSKICELKLCRVQGIGAQLAAREAARMADVLEQESAWPGPGVSTETAASVSVALDMVPVAADPELAKLFMSEGWQVVAALRIC